MDEEVIVTKAPGSCAMSEDSAKERVRQQVKNQTYQSAGKHTVTRFRLQKINLECLFEASSLVWPRWHPEELMSSSLFGYGLLGDDTTPYVRGSTPPYDLEDLNFRYPTEPSNTMNLNTSIESGTIDFADDLSDFFDFNPEVEKISSVPGNVPAPPKIIFFVDSGEEEVSEDSSTKAATPPTEAVNPTQAGRDLSSPTPDWPGLSPSKAATPPAEAVNPAQADSDISPPTTDFRGLVSRPRLSIDKQSARGRREHAFDKQRQQAGEGKLQYNKD